MATKSSTKSKSALKGTSVADVLTVKHDQVTVTAAGGNDTIKITKGNSSKINGGAGKDTITVRAGKSHIIHGNAANDTITIGKSAGTGIKSYGDAGNDIIKATNSYAVTFYGGDGSDILTGGKGADKLYGQAGADKLYGGAGKDALSGGAGNDLLNGQAGNDTLNGGGGKDTFVYANGGGSDNITDYTAGSDTLKISGGSIGKTVLANSRKDMVITIGKGKVTLKNAAGKTISMKDSRGSYTMSKSAITLGSNFAGTMDSAKYLNTVTTISGKSSAKTVTIKGNAKANTVYGGPGANTIYGYAGNDKLYGYAGNDILYGGNGNDTLYGGIGADILIGGVGKDTFVYANGDGFDTIKYYATGSDTIFISSGSISMTELTNSNNDMVLTVGTGQVTLTGAAAKTISMKDSRGSYTMSRTVITLGQDFTGTMDAMKYLDTVKSIDSRNTTKAINVTGNNQDNVIYAGKAGGTYRGGFGDDTLVGGSGVDTFVFSYGNDIIKGFEEKDTLHITDSWINGTEIVNGTNIRIHTGVNESVTLDNARGMTLHLESSTQGELWISDKQIVLGSNFTDFVSASSFFPTINVLDGRKAKGDVIAGANNVDSIIYGGYGNDNLQGSSGDDILYGGDGNDKLYGSSGNDTLYGGKGNDHIFAGTGDDLLYGGDGEDIFDMELAKSITVFDYGNGNDVIDINYQAISSTETVENDVLLHLDTGHVVNLIDAVGKDVLYKINGKDEIYTLKI